MGQRNNEPTQAHGSYDQLKPPPVQEQARTYLIQRGVLVIDDDRTQLESVSMVCSTILDIPEEKIFLVHAKAGMAVDDIISLTQQTLRMQIERTGTSFASIVSDYNLTPSFTSLHMWREIESSLRDSSFNASWSHTGRLLMTGATKEADIEEAERTHLIDGYIHKPFSLTAFETAIISAVIKRIPIA